MFASVSFPISSYKIFTYKIPASLNNAVQPGTCVNAPLKRRLQAGFVVSIRKESGYKGKIFSIDSILENEFHLQEELWKTLEWIARYYIAPLGQVLKTAVPYSLLKSYKPQNVQFIKITSKGIKILQKFDKKKPVQKRLLEALSCVDEPIRTVSLSEFVSSPYTICRQLEKEGLIKTIFQPKIMDPFDKMGSERKKNIQLSEAQEEILSIL